MIAEVQRELERRAAPEKKTWWENYVKGAGFRGTPMGDVRKIVAAFVNRHPELTEDDLKALACELIAQPLTEDKLAGVLLFSEHLIDRLELDDLPMLRGLLAAGHLADWNSCDWFCVKVLGRTRRVIEGAARDVTDERRFAQTSVGWVLRELSKSDAEAVRAFLADHGEAMSSEARRAASARL